MRLTEISIDAFGVLSRTRLDDLQPGLNVFHGSNGSGKTTILRFLRGLWVGFDEARKLRLLPPLAEGQPGGSIGLSLAERRIRVFRQALANETDRLAVTVQQGDVNEGTAIRAMLEALAPDIARLLFTAGGEENHELVDLLRSARRDGIDLSSTSRPAGHLVDRIEAVRARREAIVGHGPTPGTTHRLLQSTEESTRELAGLREEAAALRFKLSDQFAEVDRQIQALADRVEWLDLERQAVESDLWELETRPVQKRPVAPQSAPQQTAPRAAPSDQFDLRIAHAAQVLEDLAVERLHLSLRAAAALPFDETPAVTAAAFRERADIDRCESALLLHIARLRAQWAKLSEIISDPQPAASPAPVFVAEDRSPQIAELRRRRADLFAEWQQARAVWREALELRAAWDVECSRLVVLEQRIAERQIEIDIRTQQLQNLLEEARSLLLTQTALEQVQAKATDWQSSRVIGDASRHLARLTSGRYQRIVVDSHCELAIVNDSGLSLAPRSLSRGTLDQVGLSLRVALAAEYARRGCHLPLVFDDVLSDSDGDRLDAAVQLLCEAAQTQQILYFTCQERLAEAFERHEVTVRNLPGSRRAVPRIPAAGEADIDRVTLPAIETAVDEDIAVLRRRKVQPADPHWLRVDSPIVHVPSIGEQMARRLGSIGIRDLADLIAFDFEQSPVPLDTLQMTPAQLRIWQAEARMLCCIPELNGRDAQVIVAVGLMLPQELAQANADMLLRRIDRLRGDGRSGWASNGLVWPDRRTVLLWIDQAQRARTFREACIAAGRQAPTETGSPRRLFDNANLRRRLRIDRPAAELRGPRRLGPRRLERRPLATLEAAAATASAPGVELSPAPLDIPAPMIETAPAATKLRFNLQPESAVEAAPSIGPTTAKRLQAVGIVTVADLISRDPEQIAERLQYRRITADNIRTWQHQARLMCRVPELRGHDAQVLVACGITDPDAVAAMSPQTLFNVVGPFVATRDGQRLLRSAKTPDLAEVTDWIRWSQNSRALKVA